MKTLFSTLFFCLTLISIQAKTVKESISSGVFNTSNSWNPTSAPTGDEEIVINAGHIMTIQTNWNPSQPVDLVVYGTLLFDQNGKKLNLPAGSTVTVMEGGIIKDTKSDNSNRININNAVVYTGNMGTVEGPVTTNGVAPLPVSFVSFTAKALENSISLSWTTAMEQNNDRFEVERSIDGVNFETIGMVKGQLHSEVLRNYQFTDRAPLNGITYYRLRQVDVDGSLSYSNLVKVEIKVEVNISFPNPVQSSFVISSTQMEAFTVVVSDMNGRILLNLDQVYAGQNISEVENLANGHYILNISQRGTLLNQSILVK